MVLADTFMCRSGRSVDAALHGNAMLQLILRGLAHHRRIHFAIALGVMAGTAVLTGALVVGDSVRGSLTHLALDRLGTIDEVLVTDRFFRTELPQELAAQPEFKQH